MPEPWTETALPAPGAGEAEHAAHLAVAARVLEERLRDPLRPQRVSGEQDEGCDVTSGGSDVGAHWPQTSGALTSVGWSTSTCAWPPAPTTASPYAVATRRGSRSGGPTRTPGCWSSPAPACSPVDGRIPWVSPQDAPEGLRVLLGEQDGRAWFAVITGPETGPGRQGRVVPAARTAAAPGRRGRWPSAPLVFHALGLAEWLFVTRFCPRCGGRWQPQAAGHELACANCGTSSSRAPTRP